MKNAGRQPCTFSLVRYVPDPAKGEFVNIGVLLQEHGGTGRLELRFTRDWRRLRCMDPSADTRELEALEAELRQQLRSSTQVLELLVDSLSLNLQMTEPKACLAETFLTQLDALMRIYVEAPKLAREKRQAGRSAIYAQMRKQFEQEGVWDLLVKRIAVASFTQAGDPLHIDCGYQPNGVFKMFHAVSLGVDVEAAKGLAFSAPYLEEGLRQKKNAGLELTAIVEPFREVQSEDESDRLAQYRFGVETMEGRQIRVLTTMDLGRVAARAREDLHL